MFAQIYYLELLRASEGTLSRWSRLHLQSQTPASAAGRKTIAEFLSQHDENMPYRRHSVE
jgi:hypothetical protein